MALKNFFFNYKVLISIAAGLLCLIFSGISFSIPLDNITINIVWSVIFPLIIALAFEKKYVLISAFAGAAWFPFLIWKDNGYANIANIFVLISLYLIAASINPAKYEFSAEKFYKRFVLALLAMIAIFALGYLELFDYLLRFNPAPWAPNSITSINYDTLLSIFIKDLFNYTFLILLAELLLHLPVIRKLFFFKNHYHFKLNHRLFLSTMMVSVMIWFVFIILDNTLNPTGAGYSFTQYSLILMVIIWSAVLVARNLISLIEKRLTRENHFRIREEEFRSIFQSLHSGIGIIDTEGRYKFYNKWWQEKLGYTNEEMQTLRNSDITHPDDLAQTLHLINKTISGEINNFTLEKRYKKKSGEYFWGQLDVSGSRNERGNIELLAGVISDITERKMAEEALLREKHFSSRILEALPGIFYLYSYPDLRLILWNSNHEKIFGYQSEEMANKKIHSWLPEESWPQLDEAIEKVFNTGYNSIEASLLAKDGTLIPFLLTGIRFETEKQMYLLGSGIDIREKIKAEAELKAAQARQDAMIANITDVIAIIDKNGINKFKSPNVEKWFGWKPEELVGKNTFENIHPDDRQHALEVFMEIMNNPSKTGHVECRYLSRNGEYKWVEIYAVNCLTSPSIEGILINYQDISERKANLILQQEVAIARKSAEFKQKFLANISHEIRTPLTGVMGMADILSKTQLNNEQRDYINTLIQSGENLKEIINLILDYSKIEAGRITLKQDVFSIRSLAQTFESFFVSISGKDIDWDILIDPSLPSDIITDKQRLNQVIRNLVSNAVKFTKLGKVTLSFTKANTAIAPALFNNEEEILLMVEVQDTGQGIPVHVQEKIFQPFFQVENEYNRQHEGTGLGLAISKELVEMLGGTIGFDSVSGSGSRFWFTIPCKVSKATSADEKSDLLIARKTAHLNILLVEDKAVNQKVINLLMKSAGHNVVLASNGQEALDLYHPDLFNLILMDIQMPVMDGIVATRTLRKLYKNLPPIVGLSANAFEGDREKYINLGLDEYLTKPINMMEFNKVLQQLNLV